MNSLSEFLLARYAEDEAAAKAAISSQADPENGWGYGGFGSPTALTPHVGIIHERVQAEHIIRWHPARVLADVEAKRRIVAEHKIMEPRFNIVWRDGCCETCTAWGEYGGPNEDGTPNPCPTLRLLALPYADHADYQEEWKP